MSKVKATAYPFSSKTASLIRQIIAEENYEICSVVALGKWYQIGIDASFFDAGEKMNVPIEYKLDEQLSSVDIVIWLDYDYFQNTKLFDTIKLNILNALQRGKKVIGCQILSEEERQIFIKVAKENCTEFIYTISESDYQKRTRSHENIEIPIVVIAGIVNRCMVVDIVNNLSNLLMKDGYRVAFISPEPTFGLTKGKSFPSFMNSSQYTEIEKIDNFYNYIIDLQNNDKPDVIVIGLPYGILSVNDEIFEDYGVCAYEVFNAIKADLVVVSLECKKYSFEFENQIQNLMKYRYNTHIDCFCVSNIALNSDSLVDYKDNQRLEYNYYTLEKLKTQIKSSNMHSRMFAVIDNQEMKELKNYIINVLSC